MKPINFFFQSEAVVFTNTKCDICRGKLELQQDSAVHFLCQCSFHNQCYQTSCSSETDGKCPKCFGDNQDIVSKINAQLQNHSIHDSFHSQARQLAYFMLLYKVAHRVLLCCSFTMLAATVSQSWRITSAAGCSEFMAGLSTP